MLTRKVSSKYAFAGKVIVDRNFRYTVKVTKFQVAYVEACVESAHVVSGRGKIYGQEVRQTDKINWVEMEFKVISTQQSMRKTFQILTDASVKRLLGLEASKYAMLFVKNLRGNNGKVLHLNFKSQRMPTNHVDLSFNAVGGVCGATVRVESQDFVELRAAVDQI